VLQGRYCDAIRNQLAVQEEKAKKKKSNKVVRDGLPRLLTDPKFIEVVRNHKESLEQAAVELEQCRIVRVSRVELMKEWKLRDDERKKKNLEVMARWKMLLQEWEHKRDWAKADKTVKTLMEKPVRGALLPPIPKPAAPADNKDGEDGKNNQTDNEPEEGDS